MKLRTELPLPKHDLGFDPFGGMVFMGSCFSDHIGERMQHLGLPVLVNPFGVIFHPAPLLRILTQALSKEFSYTEKHLTEYSGNYCSLNHHGSFKSEDKEILLQTMNRQLAELRKHLASAHALFITLGTAWGYSLNKEVVANCHKLPNTLFEKSISSHEEVTNLLAEFLDRLNETHSHLNVVLTVSPVRHIKNGIVDDSRSKSILLAAVHEIIDKRANTHYFPSFELMMDDLRDYRFYKTDLIHPSDLAIDYIFSYLKKVLFSEANLEVLAELERFLKLSSHKVMSPNSEDYLKFQKKIEDNKSLLQRKYPKANFML